MIVRRFSPPTACVTNTRSPQTTGEELPRSGKGARQRTFSLVLHFMGRFFSADRPLPFGPRHCGQLPASRPGAAASVRVIETSIARILNMTMGWGIGFIDAGLSFPANAGNPNANVMKSRFIVYFILVLLCACGRQGPTETATAQNK